MRPFTHLAILVVSLGVAVYAMLASSGPSISANGIAVANDLSAPSTINQPQALAAQTGQLQSSIASIQQTNPNPAFSTQELLGQIALATPIAGSTGVASSLAASLSPTVSPSPTATPGAHCEPAGGGLYCVYTVKAGDTLSGIAGRFGMKGSGDLSPAEMLAESNKPAVVESNSIETGLKLRVPAENGIIHTVFSNQTLSDISQIYGVDEDDIRALALNDIGGAANLRVGQNILVPDPIRVSLPVAPAATATPEPETPTPEPEPTEVPIEVPTEIAASATPVPEASSTPRAAASSTPRRGAATPTPKAGGGGVSRSGFIWPASGPISSYFGPSHPLGIDIDFFANPNQAVGAAAAGTVTFAGGDPCCSYGYYVIIDHGNGFETLYAHFSRLAVSTGQKVTQGQTLGNGGHTGYATGDHLHFEVHLNGAIVNPTTYLP